MFPDILANIIELLIVLPLLLLYIENMSSKKWKLTGLFAVFFLLNQILLRLPIHYPSLNIIEGNWNWSGKILSIIGSLIFYLSFRSYFRNNDLLKAKQEPGSTKPIFVATFILVLISALMGYFMFSSSELKFETLGFQITMPGFDEEFAFRGILMGLLLTAMRSQVEIGILKLGHPAIWITSILFGLIHAFGFGEGYALEMNWVYFAYSFLFGWIMGWMALKSRSILLPTVAHNLSNFTGALITMIK